MGKTLRQKLRDIWGALWSSDQQRLKKILCTEYANESRMGRQFRRHAQRMQYLQFREGLLHLAAEEEGHAEWLREKILDLGGEIPEVSFPPEDGRNSWECLLKDLKEEKRCCADLEDRIHTVERINPEIGLGLRRVHGEEVSHCEELTNMLMKSDAYASSLE